MVVAFRQAVIVLNPRARRAPSERALARAAAPLVAAEWRVELRSTAARGHAVELAAQAARGGADVVIACGGDGTVNEVVNGLAAGGGGAALAVAPAGTADVWAREAGVPRDLRRALALLPAARLARVDLGVANGRRFLLMCGAGVDAEVVRRVDGRYRAKRWLGRAAYGGVALALAARWPAVRALVTVDGERMQRELLLAVAGNTRLYGGVARLTPDALVDDGALDLLLVGSAGARERLRLVVRALRGRLQEQAGVERRRAVAVTIEPERPLWWQVDGEVGGEVGVSGAPALTLAVEPRALAVLVAPRPNPLFRGAPAGR